jgi:hypothetical protein
MVRLAAITIPACGIAANAIHTNRAAVLHEIAARLAFYEWLMMAAPGPSTALTSARSVDGN